MKVNVDFNFDTKKSARFHSVLSEIINMKFYLCTTPFLFLIVGYHQIQEILVVLFNFFFRLSLSLLKLQNLFLTNGSCLSVISPNCGTDGSLMRKFGRQQVSHFPLFILPQNEGVHTQ